MSESIPLVPYMPSWRGQGKLYHFLGDSLNPTVDLDVDGQKKSLIIPGIEPRTNNPHLVTSLSYSAIIK